MINPDEFRNTAHQVVDWMADYLENIENYPVKSNVSPGEIFNRIPESPPEKSETFDIILRDFENIIIPGITHWQSPNFFAYFPANSSYPSLLGEMITATLGAQCMIWDTSPAAAELEEKVMNWLKSMLGLPENLTGVIQDTASTATLCAILTAREKYSNYKINETGFFNFPDFRIYCSSETHSSIEKAVKIAGFGKNNLVKVAVDKNYSLEPDALKKVIEADIKVGKIPVCVVATIGTTGSTAIDPLDKISSICNKFNIWLHVDAAFAGTALVLPEYRWMTKGIQHADSFVFNPHKWMFTNFDCSAYFVKDPDALIRTFEILPEYLKTHSKGKVNDYRDWGIPLGRRFRALKLWFVIRSFGIEGIRNTVKKHITLAQDLANKISASEEFEIAAPTPLNTICFRFLPKQIDKGEELNNINEKLLNELNKTGKLFLTHTKLNGKYTLRLVIGQTNVTETHVGRAWEIIQQTAFDLFR